MLALRFRAPRWAQAIPGLRRILGQRSRARVEQAPESEPTAEQAPTPSIEELIAQDRLDEAGASARASIWGAPDDAYSWRALGRIEYAKAEPDAWPRTTHPLPVTEDAELAAILARPSAAALDLDAAPSAGQLKDAIAALIAENTHLATRLEPLRRQVGYRVDAMEAVAKYSHTRLHMRALSLAMHKFGVSAVPIPPETIPDGLETDFGMAGRATIQLGYANAAYPSQCLDIYTDFDVEAFKSTWRGQPTPEDEAQARMSFALPLGEADHVLQRVFTSRIERDQTVAVIESQAPIYEALCLLAGARPTTIRRAPVINRARELTTTTFAELEKSGARVDAAIAVNVVERAGLGMHGEPLDAAGDLALMATLKRLVRPNGLLFLSLPKGLDCTVFNVTRNYGPERLPRLLDGWTVLDEQRHAEAVFHGGNEFRSLFVLANAP